ncbi:MAG: TonB family protein, partial [Thermoanaerobaculales bacterium]
LTVPLTFGWRRPVILVPRTFEHMSPEQQEGVACHELLHVQRRDWPMTVFEEGLRAALWFHPGVWVLLAKITLAREQVVDAGAVRLTGKRRQYLDALWQIVCTFRRPTVVPAVPLVGRHHLVERIELLKKEISMSKLRVTVTSALLVVALASFGFLGAAVFAAGTDVAGSLSSHPEFAQKSEKGVKDTVTPVTGECDDITHPVAVKKTGPKYPEEARKAKITGIVQVRALVTREGFVEDVEVLESPDALLSEAAVGAVRTWRFDPALCDGTPVDVWYNITIKFALK